MKWIPAVSMSCSILLVSPGLGRSASPAEPRPVATFSIVGADPDAREVGVAVASRFFAVGSVVPHGAADVGAVATQSFANTTFGPRGLDLLRNGLSPQAAIDSLLFGDGDPKRRQVGIVAADGRSATYTGEGCLAWAGGRNGPNYAAQGNILTGEPVVAAMESTFLASTGKPLAERLFMALKAGDAAGGDSRGRQSAALLVVRDRAGYNGFTDLAVDIRVDDHASPITELGRLLGLALVNDGWNRGWTAFTEKRFTEARRWQEATATRAEGVPSMLPEVLYDLAVIRLAAGDADGAAEALRRSVTLNPKLGPTALKDSDLNGLGERRERIVAEAAAGR